MGLKRLKNLNSTRTKYNASDVVLPSWRFLKDVNFGVKLEQERLNLDKGFVFHVTQTLSAWPVCVRLYAC